MSLPKISDVQQDGHDPVAWQDPCSPLILISDSGIMQASKSLPDKRALVRLAQAGEGLLILPWVGQYSTTVFRVDDYERALDGLASPSGRVR